MEDDAQDTVPRGPAFDAPPPLTLAAPPRGPRLSTLCWVRIGDGQPVALAAPLLVGRSPGAPRVPVPVLRIPVPSPTRQISADHLEITQAGSTVVLRDLRSTNGSIVTVPGQPPRLLSQGDSSAVPVGTVVDLGDGVTLEILPPMTAPDA